VQPVKQSSFAGGEVSPELYGRTDSTVYRESARLVRNFYTTPFGAAKNRPGTRFVREVKDSARATYLLPFVFSENQSYVLELGEFYMRFHTQGGTVMDPVVPTNPYEIVAPWSAAQLSKLGTPAQVNDIVTLTHPDFPPYELKRFGNTNWTLTPLSVLNDVQPPTSVSQDNAWQTIDPSDEVHPDQTWDWVVTSVDKRGVESLASVPLQFTDAILYADKIKPRFTWNPATVGPAADYWNVYRGKNGVYGWVGSSEENFFTDDAVVPDYSITPPQQRDPFIITGPAQTQLQQASIVGNTGFKTQAAEAHLDQYTVAWTALLPAGEQDDVTFEVRSRVALGVWNVEATVSVTGSEQFTEVGGTTLVTRDGLGVNSEFDLLKTGGNGTVRLDQVQWADVTINEDPRTLNYPANVCYHLQRQLFGNMITDRQAIVTSRTGGFTNFDQSRPLRPDDSLELTMASQTADAIRWMLPLDTAVVVGTDGGIWTVRIVATDSFDLDRRMSNGVHPHIDPLGVGQAALFVGRGARSVREFIYDPGSGQTGAHELSMFARHLLKPYGIVEWAYADVPENIAWAVRADGALLGITYSRQLGANGWHQHYTGTTYAQTVVGLVGDKFESVTVVPESVPVGDQTIAEDSVYVVVNRTIGGATKRYVERFASRHFNDVRDSIFLDSAIEYDGRPTGATKGLFIKPIGGITWAPQETITLEASGAIFVAGDVGKMFDVTDPQGGRCRFLVSTFTDTTHVIAENQTTVPVTMRDTNTATWARAVDALSGLTHLEGREVAVRLDDGDGGVATVASGAITLSGFGARVAVGLAYTSELWTLPLLAGGSTSAKKKTIARVAVEVDERRGLWVGEDFVEMIEPVQEQVDDFGDIPASNERVIVHPHNTWGDRAAVALQHRAPLPLSVLAVVAEVT